MAKKTEAPVTRLYIHEKEALMDLVTTCIVAEREGLSARQGSINIACKMLNLDPLMARDAIEKAMAKVDVQLGLLEEEGK